MTLTARLTFWNLIILQGLYITSKLENIDHFHCQYFIFCIFFPPNALLFQWLKNHDIETLSSVPFVLNWVLQFVSGKDKILPEDNIWGTTMDMLRKKNCYQTVPSIFTPFGICLNPSSQTFTDFYQLQGFLQNFRIHITPIFTSNDATILDI